MIAPRIQSVEGFQQGEPIGDTNPLTSAVRDHLLDREMMNLSDLSNALDVASETLRLHLDYWVHHDHAECLLPVFSNAEELFARKQTDRIFYRWRKETDKDWVWERFVT